MKKIFRHLLILILVFVAAIAAVLFLTRRKQPEVAYAVMESASLPTVTMEFEGSRVNTLHGYVKPMDIPYMRDTITPIPDSRLVPFHVTAYGNEIQSVSYQVRSLDGEQLVEEGVCEDLSGNGSWSDGQLQLQDLLQQGQEYVLVLDIQTDARDSIYYYTRIRFYRDTHLAEQVAFARSLSDLALAGESSQELLAQLESSSDADNSSLGYADIKSSYDHVTWGSLAPQRSGDVQVDIQEINQMVTSLTLSYSVTAEGDSGQMESYHVKEFFSVRYVDGKLWLIAYERTMDQVFEPSDATVQDGRIELGILSPGHLPVELRSAGDYTVFVADGELWSYNQAENEASRLYSFKEKNDDGVRTLYDQHRFRIIDVKESGDVSFTVYGYMNRGSHEGETGLAFYRYTRQENAIREIFFIPSDKPYQVLEREIGTLSCVGDNELFYLMYGDSIYAIDFSGEEYVEVVSGLKNDSLVVSEDSSAVAWQMEDDLYGGKTIQVFYMDDGTTFEIRAQEGETIRALGFIDGDFIYGKARESDIERGSLTVKYPMYALEIVGRDQQVQTTYQPAGCYIESIQVEDGKVRISREAKEADGSWVAVSEDALIQNQIQEEEESVVASRESDKKKTVYYLDLASSENEGKVLSITTPKEAENGESRELTLISTADQEQEDGHYYAYACGRLAGAYDSAADAIWAVYDQMGVVVDSAGGYVWTRANRAPEASVELKAPVTAATQEESLQACLTSMLGQEGISLDVGGQLAAGKTAYEILDEAFSGRAVDLQGCILNQILYYVHQGYPVLAVTEGNKAELIVGYDVYTNLVIYDPLTGSTYLMSEEDAESYYGTYNDPFVSWTAG